MGPDVAVELANNAGKHGPQIWILVGDNDSSITKKVRETVLTSSQILSLSKGQW